MEYIMLNVSEKQEPIQSKITCIDSIKPFKFKKKIMSVYFLQFINCELLVLVIIRQNQFSGFVTLQNQNKGINSNQA